MRTDNRTEGRKGGRLHLASLALVMAVVPGMQAQQAQQNPDSAVAQLVRDYTGLYRADTFLRWQQLFLPTFTSTSPAADGALTVRSAEEFIDAQRQGFGSAREMREELENVRIERQGRIASVWADFIFHYNGQASRGKLVLLCVADRLNWKIQSLAFAYDR